MLIKTTKKVQKFCKFYQNKKTKTKTGFWQKNLSNLKKNLKDGKYQKNEKAVNFDKKTTETKVKRLIFL